MKLRDYQVDCINTVNHLEDGAKSVVCLATGLGKTAVAANFDYKGRVLWLSHRDELVRQPEQYFAERGMSFGIEKATEHAADEDVVSASVQSLSRDARLTQFQPDAFDMIICDEAQHAAAPSYKKILSYFTPRKLIGLTATPKRGDGVGLNDVFDTICFVKDLRWGIENGYLSRIRCLHIDSNYNMDDVSLSMGDFTASGLENAMSTSDNDVVVAKAYLKHCYPERKRSLIYCPTIATCEQVAHTMKSVLPEEDKETVVVLSDKVPQSERNRILSEYREGKILAIVNCMILTEGTDLPETEVIINNRPSANSSLYQQIIGRGTRLSEGKDYCLIIDILGKNYRAKNICTAPTLFGIDPEYLPPDIQKKIEEEDLLDVSKTIIDQRSDLVMGAQLIEQLIDIFMQDRQALIKDNAEYGFTTIADRYRHQIEEEATEELDFGDILAKKTPDESHYYKISATYDGYIYFSKPDMLNLVSVEFAIPDTDPEVQPVSCISDRMKFEDALAFVYDYLKYVIPERYAFKWSRESRRRMNYVAATERQVWRIEKEYQKYHIKTSAKALTKLQASDLIDLQIELAQQEKKKRLAAEKIKDTEKVRKGRSLKKWQEQQEQQKKSQECVKRQKKRAYKMFRENTEKLVEARKRAANEVLKKEAKKAEEPQQFFLKLNYSYFSKKSISSRQRIYIHELCDKARVKGILFNRKIDPSYLKMDMWHAGFIITYLIYVTKNTPRYNNYTVEYDLISFMKTVRLISKENRPEFIPCSYSLIPKREESLK